MPPCKLHNPQTFEQFVHFHQRFVDAVIQRNTSALLQAYSEKLKLWIDQAKKALTEQGFC